MERANPQTYEISNVIPKENHISGITTQAKPRHAHLVRWSRYRSQSQANAFHCRTTTEAASSVNAPAPLDPNELRALLLKIDSNRGQHTTATLLKLLPLPFVRGGDLRKMRWVDIDFDNKQWVFDPQKKVDGRQIRGFITPLTTQSIELISGMKLLTGHSEYVFPGRGTHIRTLSSNTINKALQALGYNTRADISGHGFRALARTLGVERLGEEPRIIEYQLTHTTSEALGTAYDRVKYLPERTEFMQRWADYLTALKRGDVMPPLGVYFNPAAAIYAGSAQQATHAKAIDDGIDWNNEI